MSGFTEVASVAASTKTLFGRRLRKTLSAAANHVGRMIMLASADTDRALDKAAYQVAEELRSLNCTLAAIAIADDHEGARLYLRRIVQDGIAEHHRKAWLEARFNDVAG